MSKAQLASSQAARGGALVVRRPLPFTAEETQHFLARIDRMLAPNLPDVRLTSNIVLGEQTKYLSWDIPARFGSIELVQLTDVQFGHVSCKVARVREYLKWILSEPNRFLLLTGDLVDAWAMWSPGRAFEQLGDPQTQVYKFIEVFAPVRHRILGYVGGNHERRAIPGFGDLGILIATLLRVPYSGGRQVIDIHFGKHRPFKVSLWHGVGSARTKGTVAQTLKRFMDIGDSQLYLMGHLHQALVMPDWKEARDGNRLVIKKSMGAVGSSFLESWGVYGEVSGYGVSDVLMARAVLESNGKWELTLR